MLIYENVLTVRDNFVLFYMEDVQLYSFNMKKHMKYKSKPFQKEDLISTKTNNIQGAAFHLFLPLCAFR